MFGESLPPVDYNLPGVLHYLQAEWRRFERERNEWTIERAELKARIALLEGERRGMEKLKLDMIKRIKMLEYALWKERKRHLDTAIQQPPANVMDDKVEVDISGFPGSYSLHQPSQTIEVSKKPPVITTSASRVCKEGRTALKTCLQEINYLTSLPSKLPLTYTLAASIRRDTKPINKPSSSQQQHTSSTIDTTVQDSPAVPSSVKSIQDITIQQVTPNSLEDNTFDEQSRINTCNPYSPLLPPPRSVSPAIDNVNKVGMESNRLRITSSTPQNSPMIRRDSAILTSDDNDGLSKSVKEKYNISNENMQKVIKNVNKGIKKNSTRSISPEPHEIDLNDLGVGLAEKISPDSQTPTLWKIKMLFKGHLDSVRAVAFHPTDMLMASGSDDGTVKIIHLDRNSGNNATKKSHEDLDATTTYRGHSNIVTSVAISGEQNRVYSASLDSTLRVWRLPSAQHSTFSPVDPSLYITSFVGHTDAIWDFKLSPTRPLLASASADGTVKIWNTEGNGGPMLHSWSYEKRPTGGKVTPTSLDFCRSDPSKLVVSYNNAKIQLLDIETGKLISTFTGSDNTYDSTHRTQINKVISHRSLGLVISGHEDGHIKFFDINNGKSTYSMSAHLDGVTSLDMDYPNGMTWVSGGHDTSIRLWDIKKSKSCIQEFPAHRKKGDEAVLDIQYHRSFPWMVSGGADGIVKIYHHGP
ncbi:WD40-repeat-containing domain protein [Chlamydoabsidia padenii]|nr:WD40-repeat-containing domain protein [Chlamydoabsidia padenii]